MHGDLYTSAGVAVLPDQQGMWTPLAMCDAVLPQDEPTEVALRQGLGFTKQLTVARRNAALAVGVVLALGRERSTSANRAWKGFNGDSPLSQQKVRWYLRWQP